MKYAKLTIKPKTPFLSLLQSDTIFGNFAWGYRYVFGEKELKASLNRALSQWLQTRS